MRSSASAKARLSTLGQAKISRPPASYRTMPSRMLVAATAATSAPAAGGDGLPARHDVEVLAAGHAGRLVVGPLALPHAGLLAGLGEQHGPAAPGARVDGQQVRSAHPAALPCITWACRAAGFTTLAGTRPASSSATAVTARCAPRARVSAVAPPMCGVT